MSKSNQNVWIEQTFIFSIIFLLDLLLSYQFILSGTLRLLCSTSSSFVIIFNCEIVKSISFTFGSINSFFCKMHCKHIFKYITPQKCLRHVWNIPDFHVNCSFILHFIFHLQETKLINSYYLMNLQMQILKMQSHAFSRCFSTSPCWFGLHYFVTAWEILYSWWCISLSVLNFKLLIKFFIDTL